MELFGWPIYITLMILISLQQQQVLANAGGRCGKQKYWHRANSCSLCPAGTHVVANCTPSTDTVCACDRDIKSRWKAGEKEMHRERERHTERERDARREAERSAEREIHMVSREAAIRVEREAAAIRAQREAAAPRPVFASPAEIHVHAEKEAAAVSAQRLAARRRRRMNSERDAQREAERRSERERDVLREAVMMRHLAEDTRAKSKSTLLDLIYISTVFSATNLLVLLTIISCILYCYCKKQTRITAANIPAQEGQPLLAEMEDEDEVDDRQLVLPNDTEQQRGGQNVQGVQVFLPPNTGNGERQQCVGAYQEQCLYDARQQTIQLHMPNATVHCHNHFENPQFVQMGSNNIINQNTNTAVPSNPESTDSEVTDTESEENDT